jgi:hypothetical protein
MGFRFSVWVYTKAHTPPHYDVREPQQPPPPSFLCVTEGARADGVQTRVVVTCAARLARASCSWLCCCAAGVALLCAGGTFDHGPSRFECSPAPCAPAVRFSVRWAGTDGRAGKLPQPRTASAAICRARASAAIWSPLTCSSRHLLSRGPHSKSHCLPYQKAESLGTATPKVSLTSTIARSNFSSSREPTVNSEVSDLPETTPQ